MIWSRNAKPEETANSIIIELMPGIGEVLPAA
jgi:hypothetical protein